MITRSFLTSLIAEEGLPEPTQINIGVISYAYWKQDSYAVFLNVRAFSGIVSQKKNYGVRIFSITQQKALTDQDFSSISDAINFLKAEIFVCQQN